MTVSHSQVTSASAVTLLLSIFLSASHVTATCVTALCVWSGFKSSLWQALWPKIKSVPWLATSRRATSGCLGETIATQSNLEGSLPATHWRKQNSKSSRQVLQLTLEFIQRILCCACWVGTTTAVLGPGVRRAGCSATCGWRGASLVRTITSQAWRIRSVTRLREFNDMDFGKIFISLETGSKLRFVNRFAAAQHLQKKLANHPFCEHVQMALRQAKTLVRASLQTAGQGPVAISAAQIQDCRDVVGMQEFKAQCQRAGVPENWLHIGHLPGRDSTVGFSFTWCSSTHSHPVLAKDVQLLLTCHDFMRTFFEKRIYQKIKLFAPPCLQLQAPKRGRGI